MQRAAAWSSVACVLFLYRPPQTYMPYNVRRRSSQAEYNRDLQAKFRSSVPAPAPPPKPGGAAHAETLVRAVHAAVEGERDGAQDLFTEDVTAWTPALQASSRTELLERFAERDDALSDVEVEVRPLPVVGDHACAEWTVTATHSGTLTLGDGSTLEPTGLKVTLQGVAVAEFNGDRICALRQYWDELSLFEQLGLLHEAE